MPMGLILMGFICYQMSDIKKAKYMGGGELQWEFYKSETYAAKGNNNEMCAGSKKKKSDSYTASRSNISEMSSVVKILK